MGRAGLTFQRKLEISVLDTCCVPLSLTLASKTKLMATVKALYQCAMCDGTRLVPLA